jgi:hypothetical protein
VITVVTAATPAGGRCSGNRRRILVLVTVRWMGWMAVAVLAAVAAFVYLDPILAAFLSIMLLTVVVIASLARDWERHATYEERELERARRRAEKWERGRDARERDRVRWEAHQARQDAKRAGRPEV